MNDAKVGEYVRAPAPKTVSVALWLALCVPAACSDDVGPQPEANDSSPVLIVPTQVIPVDDLVPGGFAGLISATVSADGLVCIADSKDSRAIVLDANLNLLGIFGSEGSGPGEFRHPVVCTATESSVLVLDSMTSRLTEFDRAGGLRGTRPIERTVSASPALLGDGRILSLDADLMHLEVLTGGADYEKIRLPDEMCSPAEPFNGSMFALLAASPAPEGRSVMTFQLPCANDDVVPIVTFDITGHAEFTVVPVFDRFAWPVRDRRDRSGRQRRTVAIASIAAGESMVAVLHASSGTLDERSAIALDLITEAKEHPIRRYVSTTQTIARGSVAVLPGDRLLIVDQDAFFVFEHEALRLSSEQGGG